MSISSAKHLKVMRQAAGWTQKQLADKAGCHVCTVVYWENKAGFLKGPTVNRIQAALKAVHVTEMCAPLIIADRKRREPKMKRLLDIHIARTTRCGARTRKGEPCKARPIPGNRRCKNHGGLSTGARTPEGRERIRQAQLRRWDRAAGLQESTHAP